MSRTIILCLVESPIAPILTSEGMDAVFTAHVEANPAWKQHVAAPYLFVEKDGVDWVLDQEITDENFDNLRQLDCQEVGDDYTLVLYEGPPHFYINQKDPSR